MFARIAGFELRYQLRQPVFYVAAAVFFLLSFGSIASDNVGLGASGAVHRNSPFVIAQATLIFTQFYMLVTTAFVANVVIRDDATGYGPIVRSTPIRKFDYLFGRFTGAFIAVLLAFLAVPAGFIVGAVMPWVDPETVGPMRLQDHVHSYFVFAVPGLLLSSAIFFALATVTRSMMATYLGVVGFLVVYTVATTLLSRPEFEDALALLEPFGTGAFIQATEYWTAAERNTRNVALDGVILANRAIAIGLSLAFLALAYRLFRFETRGRAARRKEKLAKLEAAAPAAAAAGALPSPSFGAATAWAVLAKRTRFEMAQVFKSPAFAVLVLLGVLLAGTTLWFSGEMFGTNTYPVTRVMIEGLQAGFGIILLIVSIYYSGELVWRERERRVHEITDSSAAPDWAFVVPKTMAIAGVLIAIQVVAVLTGIGVQIAKGWYEFELGKYLVWFLIPGAVNMILYAVLAVFVQAMSPNKFVGWGIMVLYFISTIVLTNLGLDHGLYRFNSGPGVPLSDMNGRGDFWRHALWFDLYWSALGVIMLVIAYGLWRRGTETRYAPRLRRLPHRLAGAPGLIGGVALVAFVGLGGWIFVNTNVWNEYRSRPSEERWQADYEKTLLRYEDVPQPAVAQVTLNVELHPHDTRAVTRGVYLLENRTGAPLNEVHVRLGERDLKLRSLRIDGARRARDFPRFDYAIYRFDRPMQPGEQRRMMFETELGQRGFKNSGNTTRIVDNGTFINNFEFAPMIGMTRDGALQDRAKRRKYGLPPELRPAKLEDESARAFNELRSDWVRSDITVSTVADQTPLAPGYKVSDAVSNGRRTARFVSDAPIHHFFSVQSARYVVTQEPYKGVNLAVYHDAQHGRNVPRMINALKVGLDYYQSAFGPYQFRQARIIEFPAYATFAQAFANTMPYSEGFGFIADFRDPEKIDFATYVTAHELAHQWWAHQVVGADMQGSTMLTETLAQYSALVVMERIYGPDQVRKFLKYELDRYLSDRGSELVEELPLIRVEGQQYIHYRKGSMAMYLLKDMVGEAAVNRALKRLVEARRFQGAPYPRSTDLIRLIREEAGPEHQGLITDLFERITLYDVKTTEAEKRRRPDGRWDVTLTVEAEKLYADGEGNETAAPLNEPFDVGVFTAEPGKKGFDRNDVLFFERRPIRTGTQKITLTVPREPIHVGVDPYNKRIDRDSGDNLRKVG
jgi:aminopeptidase N